MHKSALFMLMTVTPASFSGTASAITSTPVLTGNATKQAFTGLGHYPPDWWFETNVTQLEISTTEAALLMNENLTLPGGFLQMQKSAGKATHCKKEYVSLYQGETYKKTELHVLKDEAQDEIREGGRKIFCYYGNDEENLRSGLVSRYLRLCNEKGKLNLLLKIRSGYFSELNEIRYSYNNNVNGMKNFPSDRDMLTLQEKAIRLEISRIEKKLSFQSGEKSRAMKAFNCNASFVYFQTNIGYLHLSKSDQ